MSASSAWPGEMPAAVDVDEWVRSVREASANDPDDETAMRALGNGLVVEFQLYLEAQSDEYDVELFFEVHGREPADLGEWIVNIAQDLHRHDLDAEQVSTVVDRACRRAVEFIDSGSSLAFGTHS